MSWRSHTEVNEGGTLHTWPEVDVQPHVTEGSEPCWCSPDAEFYDNGTIQVIHRDELDRLELEPAW